MSRSWGGVLQDTLAVLTFRATRETLAGLGGRHLLLGLLCTWVVGMGRYWDDPDAELLQHLGVGSVVYVFALSLILFLLIWPLAPENWSVVGVLSFVVLTSPPALLYAIPVERFTSFAVARQLNIGFLAVVALWRVALLVFYLLRHARLRWFVTAVAALLPLALIVVSLAVLNLEHVVFDIMGGLRDDQHSTNEGAYMVVVAMAMLSYVAAPVLLLLYAGMVVWVRVRLS